MVPFSIIFVGEFCVTIYSLHLDLLFLMSIFHAKLSLNP
jgi:hypothetical protein